MKLSETGIPGVWCRRYPTGRKKYGFTVVWKGLRYQRVSKVNTQRGAAAERQRAVERLAAGLPVDEQPEAQPFTVRNAVEGYLSASEGLRSLPTARLHARHLIEHFSDLPVEDISQVAIAGFRRRRTESGVGPATVNRALSFLRAAINHARGEGLIEGEHYFARLSKADRRKVFLEEPRTAGLRRVSDAEFEAVVAGLRPPYQPLARLLLATGMRRGEATGLRWREVRGDAVYLTRTKSGKARWVPLAPAAVRLIPTRPEGAGDDELVFRGVAEGNLGNNFGRAWRAARKAAGLPWMRIHDLRHEAASRYLESGGTLRELQELGGWSDLSLVERYSKTDRDRIRETLSRVPQPSPESAAESTVSPPIASASMVRLRK